MGRKKSNSEDRLKNIIRSQKTIIKNLKKEVARSNKKQSREEELELQLNEYLKEEEQERKIIFSTEVCPQCAGSLDVADLGIRKMYLCTTCDYRKVVKGSSG